MASLEILLDRRNRWEQSIALGLFNECRRRVDVTESDGKCIPSTPPPAPPPRASHVHTFTRSHGHMCTRTRFYTTAGLSYLLASLTLHH